MMLRSWASDGSQLQLQTDDMGALSRAQVESETRQLANHLMDVGIGPGDRVLLLADPSFAYLRICIATLRVGAVAVLVNPAYTERELRHAVVVSRPTAFYCASEPVSELLEMLGSVGANLGGFDGPGSALPSSLRPMFRIASGSVSTADHRLDNALPDDAAVVLFTSGTTGLPKGALMSHRNLGTNIAALAEAWQWGDHDRLLLSLPVFHMHGFGIGVCGSLALGAFFNLLPSFDPIRIAGSIENEQFSAFFGVPTMYQRLADSGRCDSLSKLRLVVSGSAPMSEHLHRELKEATGQYVLERYGMTETAMITSNPLNGERIPGTVGGALPSVEVALEVETGEIKVKGPSLFQGYLGDATATSAAFDAEGWFRSGDAGSWQDQDHLRISGRLKDLIITGGFNVFPGEVEAVLRDFGGVSEAAVVGAESDAWGEEVVAFVKGVRGDETAILDHLRRNLVNYKVPKRLIFVDSIPRNALGKVLYQQLRESLKG